MGDRCAYTNTSLNLHWKVLIPEIFDSQRDKPHLLLATIATKTNNLSCSLNNMSHLLAYHLPTSAKLHPVGSTHRSQLWDDKFLTMVGLLGGPCTLNVISAYSAIMIVVVQP
jgi:hypothetical protein